jgi:hypothetical protein
MPRDITIKKTTSPRKMLNPMAVLSNVSSSKPILMRILLQKVSIPLAGFPINLTNGMTMY